MGANAVVLLSGGLDSTTVLAMAKAGGFDIHTISFDYGQRHQDGPVGMNGGGRWALSSQAHRYWGLK